MSHIQYIIYLFFTFVSFSYSQSNLNIALFNFNNSQIDQRNEVAVNLSDKIINSFINTMKDDMRFLSNKITFIQSDVLEKELREVREILLKELEKDLRNGIASFISKERLFEIINKASMKNMDENQVRSLADSLIYSISNVTKDVTKELLLSNIIKSGESTEITTGALYDFIESNTKKSLMQSSFSSFIASANKEFKTDMIVTGKYSIIENEIEVTFFVYKYSDFSLINTISARSPLDKGNILIKDLEFKLLKNFGIALDDYQKAELCRYDISKFSSKDNNLYFTDIFQADDMIELKYKMLMSDSFDIINYHYFSLFSGLLELNIPYKVKFYSDNNLYRIYSTESVSDGSVQVDVLRNNWSDQRHVGNLNTSQSINLSAPNPKKTKMVVGIDFSSIEAVYFVDEQNTINMLKQVFIYTFVIGSGFLLSLLL